MKVIRLSCSCLLLLAVACSDATPINQTDAGPLDTIEPITVPDLIEADSLRPPADLGPDQFIAFESLELTVNEIPVPMNGSQPFTNAKGDKESFRLAVPPHGFTLDLTWRGSAVQTDKLQITASVALGDMEAPAGSNLAKHFALDSHSARLLIPEALSLPEGPVTFEAKLSDGNEEKTASLTVDIAKRDFLADPFRLEDRWLLAFSQDLYSISLSTDDQGKLSFVSEVKSNGISDFTEDLRAMGFGSATPLADAAKVENRGVIGAEAIVREWIKDTLIKSLRTVYQLNEDGSKHDDSVNIAFFLEGSPQAPKLEDYQYQQLEGGESTKNFSVIGIGGGDISKSLLGRSKTIDPRNVQSEDNLGPGHGVFVSRALATIIDFMDTDPTVKILLGTLFGEFIAEFGDGGKPIGEDPVDAEILSASFDPKTATGRALERYENLAYLIDILGGLAGALTAHEIGHSLGLVTSGAPPYGLFGGQASAAEFVLPDRTAPGHIDTAGFNIMEAGPGSVPGATINFTQYLTQPKFGPLNLAYLRGRLLLLAK